MPDSVEEFWLFIAKVLLKPLREEHQDSHLFYFDIDAHFLFQYFTFLLLSMLSCCLIFLLLLYFYFLSPIWISLNLKNLSFSLPFSDPPSMPDFPCTFLRIAWWLWRHWWSIHTGHASEMWQICESPLNTHQTPTSLWKSRSTTPRT